MNDTKIQPAVILLTADYLQTMQQEYAPGRHENSAGLVRCIRGKAIQMRRTFQQKGTRLQGRPILIRNTDGRQTGVQTCIFSIPLAELETSRDTDRRASHLLHIFARGLIPPLS